MHAPVQKRSEQQQQQQTNKKITDINLMAADENGSLRDKSGVRNQGTKQTKVRIKVQISTVIHSAILRYTGH